MSWHARLSLDVTSEAGRSVARYAHDGPLRILQTLYPEGDGTCHNVLVHPPGGIVGGDVLDIDVQVGTGAHGLLTTPGATRFYRSAGEPGVQQARIRLDAGARFEWLPLEAICYSGCIAENRVRFELEAGAEAIGWDVTAFGLPESGEPFARGSLLQHLELAQAWLERGRIDADDRRLLDGPLGFAGHRCMASLFFLAGTPLSRERREAALDAARAVLDASELAPQAGATSPGAQVVVVRVLSPLVEPAMQLLRSVRAAWRPLLWQLPPTQPRVWSL
jgi:urease accessory protein